MALSECDLERLHRWLLTDSSAFFVAKMSEGQFRLQTCPYAVVNPFHNHEFTSADNWIIEATVVNEQPSMKKIYQEQLIDQNILISLLLENLLFIRLYGFAVLWSVIGGSLTLAAEALMMH
jgi:hypothetical protein